MATEQLGVGGAAPELRQVAKGAKRRVAKPLAKGSMKKIPPSPQQRAGNSGDQMMMSKATASRQYLMNGKPKRPVKTFSPVKKGKVG